MRNQLYYNIVNSAVTQPALGQIDVFEYAIEANKSTVIFGKQKN